MAPSSNKKGFVTQYGVSVFDASNKLDRSYPKKKQKDKKIRYFFAAPLFRSKNPNVDRPWDFFETGEAVDVLKMKISGLDITPEILHQLAGWSKSMDRYLTIEEIASAYVNWEIHTPKSAYQNFDLSFNPERGDIRRVIEFNQDELRDLTLQQLQRGTQEKIDLGRFGQMPREQALREVQDMTAMGYKIIRRQIVEIETAISLIAMEQFKFPNIQK